MKKKKKKKKKNLTKAKWNVPMIDYCGDWKTMMHACNMLVVTNICLVHFLTCLHRITKIMLFS
jgi:hypothetical protein